LRRYLYYYQQLSGHDLVSDTKFSLADRATYRVALAAIDHPSILRWRRRVGQLSEEQLRRRYKTEGGVIRLTLARCRELASMLANAVTSRGKAD
jgi:hypothetical protein